jgi:TetR/AcrR family transcriptional regulator, regulator of cefoperazone and chloramphenicol sensitivity
MSEPASPVEEKIILATIDCIEQVGLSGATNRRIAQAAGVNLAAINYYFRSKDVLIQRVMEITLDNAFDLSDVPPMPGETPQERCAAIFLHLLEGGLQYPGITRAHFYNLLAEGQPDPLVAGYLNRFIETLALDLHARLAPMPLDDLKRSLTQIFSAITLAILAPGLFESNGVDLREADGRKRYVDELVKKMLAYLPGGMPNRY